MTQLSTCPPSTVDFPSTPDPFAPAHAQIPRPPHLPFRRISLPSAPSLIHRQSVVSTASFDSLPEEGSSTISSSPLRTANRSPSKRVKSRPSSLDPHRKPHRKKDLRPVDEEREAKRRKIIEEFYETERTYVKGLDLIYSHFLTPIIASLDTPQPLLTRSELTSVFSNFIDIWNLHRSFFTSLTDHLRSSTSANSQDVPPPLSPVLLSHFPYLSLYTPFVTSFHTSITALTGLLTSNAAFSAFVAKQEADPRCGKLKLRDWLLTIVQRCPRYLLLLKDLIGCTDAEEPERVSLMAVHTLVSKITISLNTSLHTHAQTLSLLSLQRSTPNLPFQLISPGRTFLKRGALLQLEHGSLPREREFLLFSDCLIWLANLDRNDKELPEWWDWNNAGGASHIGKGRPGSRPPMLRSRSRSEAELSALRAHVRNAHAPASRPSFGLASPSKVKKRQASSGVVEEKWWFKGRAELVDLEVVVSPLTEVGEETRFEVLSPETSFALYAASEDERDEWSTAIRNAKASLLVSLNVTQPNSTLTSSASTNHLRRTLQALPHLPEDDARMPKRGKVEHFVPAIWIPDGKTESYDPQTFFISDSNAKDATRPSRACDACYETVFPIIDRSASPRPTTSSYTLSGFTSWQSMPALAMPGQAPRPASVLMAIDRGSPKRALPRIDDVSEGVRTPATLSDNTSHTNGSGIDGSDGPSRSVIRVRSPSSRPRSFYQILEDFHDHDPENVPMPSPSPSRSYFSAQTDDSSGHERDHGLQMQIPSELFDMLAGAASEGEGTSASGMSLPPTPRREDTARKNKRFSLPAVALHTTPVTARPKATGEGLAKRFSLVLGVRATSREKKGAAETGEEGMPSALDESPLRHGAAAVKLSQLLGRRKGS
ncbi:hypothetical protein EW146_g2389 [Bondarzewia mesenterica]|uniref:DH domain-containing protein n=1 Tax=Bondarzewia mesenterica TaxID=1095465 RepID=A0A4S4M0U8_9AGAM|nr:hypothetical protein EW146_g2389 [Bondarzewia mesenterica]